MRSLVAVLPRFVVAATSQTYRLKNRNVSIQKRQNAKLIPMKTLDLEGLQKEARELARTLRCSSDGALVVALSGELGAGKTTFVQSIAQELGVDEVVTSPTFVLEKVYQLNEQIFKRLVHIDAYRLNGVHELAAIGWDEIVKDPSNLILVEWPEKIVEAIPGDAIRISFAGGGENRTISYGKEND